MDWERETQKLFLTEFLRIEILQNKPIQRGWK